MRFTSGTDESKLIEACIANNRLAQKALYDRYKDAMYTLAYRITGNFQDANEVLQDAFLRVFRALPKFRRESTLGAWIKIIVIRVALTKVKKRVTFEPIDTLKETNGLAWQHPLDTDYLEKAIQSLPEGYRTVFILIEVEGYKHREVAEMLKISEGTSKSQLYHAKKHLQKMLQKARKYS